jgi:ADP-heptose:LPS heptosyltransferase
MAPGGRQPTRLWRVEGFRETAEQCFASLGMKTFLAWGPGEIDLAEQVRHGRESFISLLPPTSMRQLGAIIKKAAVVVTNDSGNKHTAVAVGTPTVTIYGPTRPIDWNPGGPNHLALTAPGLACLGCHLNTCPVGHLCMTNIHGNDVMSAIQKILTEVSHAG